MSPRLKESLKSFLERTTPGMKRMETEFPGKI